MKTVAQGLLLSAVLSASAVAGPILIVNGASNTTETGTTSAITTNLDDLHTLAGNTVTIADTMPVDLSGYTQVWDIRFFNAAALNTAEQTQYIDFMANGGGLFLMGENNGFTTRNNSVFSLIDAAGGGTVGFTSCSSTQTVKAPFTGPNAVSQVTYAAPGCFNATGNGEWITSAPGDTMGSGLAFSVGAMSNAMAGSLTTILDVNFMMNQYDLPNSQLLTMNLINYVAEQVEPTPPTTPPTQVDEPYTAMLLASGLFGLLGLRRRRK